MRPSEEIHTTAFGDELSPTATSPGPPRATARIRACPNTAGSGGSIVQVIPSEEVHTAPARLASPTATRPGPPAVTSLM